MAGERDDAVWIDVLPSMGKFGDALARDVGKEADKVGEKAGKSAGAKFGKAFAIGSVALIGGVGAVGKALYNLGDTFDGVTDTIRTGTGAMGGDLDKLVASAKTVGTKVPAAWEDIGTTVADVNTRIGLTGPTLEKVSGQFLELGRITNEEIDIKGASASFAAFGIEGDKVSGALDHLYQVSQASGVGVNELTAKLSTNGAVVKQLGLSFNEAAVLVGSLDKAGINANVVMSSLGRSMTNLAKKGEDPKKAFARVTGELEALVKQGKTADAVNLAGKVFGTKGAPQMIAALQSGAVSFKDLDKMAGQTADTIEGAGTDTMDFAEQWNLFQNKMNTLVAPAAEKVFGIVGEGMTWINDNAVPALEAFTREWENGTGRGGEFRAQVASIGETLKSVAGFVVRHRDTIKTLAVGIAGGVLVYKALTLAVTAYRIAAGVASGVTVAYTATKTALTAAVASNVATTLRETVAVGASRVAAVASTVATGALTLAKKALSASTWLTIGGFLYATAVMVAHKVASTAVSAATKAMAAAQWLINAAMSANPIGLVVLALAALVGGLIYAYKNSESFRRIVTAAWDGIKGAAAAAWGWLRPNVIDPMQTFFGTTLPRSIENFGRTFGTVWEGLKAAAAAPINFVIGTVYNNGLRKALNLIPGVSLAEASLVQFRTGGYTGNGDPNHAAGVVHGREYVLTEGETAAMGGPGGVEAWKATVLGRGYKGGGYVWPTNSRALSGNYAGHSGIDVAVPTGSPLYAVSDGTVAYQGSGRGYGNAIFLTDASGVPWVYGHGSRALVNAGQKVNRGQLIGYSGWSGNVRPAGPAGAHLHVEAARAGFANAANRDYTFGLLNGSATPSGTAAGPGGDSGMWDLLTKFPQLIENVKTGLTGMAGPWADLLRPGVRGVVDGVKRWGLDKIKGLADTVSKTAVNVATAPNVLLGRGLAAARGWNGGEWDALNQLWERESNWNHLAKNPSSGAYGIPQALPARKMASAGWDWLLNPATQIRWGLGYIAERYDTPSKAWSAWQSRSPHWYANGTGTALPGPAVVGELGLPELVVGPQARYMNGGERVYSSAQTRSLLGGSNSSRMVSGTLTLDEDGRAYIAGVAEDVYDDRAEAASRWARNSRGD